MKVKLAKTAGFCMGVRKAVEKALTAAEQMGSPVYTHGPLIHNNQVLEVLAGRGIVPLPEDGNTSGKTVVIRAHGIPPALRKELRESGARVVNATCPRVARVQSIIKRYSGKGYFCVIVGDENHAEVVGLKGFAKDGVAVVSGVDELPELPDGEKVLVVAQTTQSDDRFQEVVDHLSGRHADLLPINTICDSTHKRQSEIRSLAREVDALVVVGGFHSGNTRRLAEIGRSAGVPTFHVETAQGLDRKSLSRFKTIGVTAGASTPNWMIKNVVEEIHWIRPFGTARLPYVVQELFRAVVWSNLFVALAAASLGYAALSLIGASHTATQFFIVLNYVYAMHLLNRYTDQPAARFNDPARVRFLEENRLVLMGSGIVATLLALGLSASTGLVPFGLLLIMSFFGITYAIPVIPRWWLRWIKLPEIKTLKDIPGSKTFFIAAAWALVTTVIPASVQPGLSVSKVAYGFLVVFIMVLIRSALFDLLDLQGDRLVGKETIPVFIGKQNTRTLLWMLTALLGLVFVLGAGTGIATGLAYGLLAVAGYLAGNIYIHLRGLASLGYRTEAFLETGFIFAGLIALIYRAF